MIRRKLLAAVGILVALHLVMRLLGTAEHTGVLAGMPRSGLSYALGPLHVLLHLFTVIVAPILVGAALLDALLARVSRRPPRQSL